VTSFECRGEAAKERAEMSSARAMARFPDGTVSQYTYVGTVDQVAAEPRPESNAARPWERALPRPCGHRSIVPVEIWTAYGGGFFWEGRACRDCRHITHGSGPFEDRKLPGRATPVKETRCDGNPEWVNAILAVEERPDAEPDRS
jgi:hypothetical protein